MLDGSRGEAAPRARFSKAHAREGTAAHHSSKGRQEGALLLLCEEAPRILEATEIWKARLEPPVEKMISSLGPCKRQHVAAKSREDLGS